MARLNKQQQEKLQEAIRRLKEVTEQPQKTVSVFSPNPDEAFNEETKESIRYKLHLFLKSWVINDLEEILNSARNGLSN